jgi:nucleoid DNA-binding protein
MCLKMTKNEIAKNITMIADEITRVITSNEKINFTVGQIYDNRGKAESWAYNPKQDFMSEIGGKYKYVLFCKNVPVHEVDYGNEEEVDILNAYESECEVLVPAETKMRITYVSTDEDFYEMGYYTVELEVGNS